MSSDAAAVTAVSSDAGVLVPRSSAAGVGLGAPAVSSAVAGSAALALSGAVRDGAPCPSAASPDSPPGHSRPPASTTTAAAAAIRRLRRRERGPTRSSIRFRVPLADGEAERPAKDCGSRFGSARATRRTTSATLPRSAPSASPTRLGRSALLALRDSTDPVPAIPRRPSACRSLGRAFAARATSRARSGVSTSHRNGRGDAICRRASSHSSIRRCGTRGCASPRCSPICTWARTRPIPLSRHPSATSSTTRAAPVHAASPSPTTNTGRPSPVTHQVPLSRAPGSPSSSIPRSTLATSVLHSPSDRCSSTTCRRARRLVTLSVHHGSSTSCPSRRRTTSSGAATCSAPANAQPAHPASAPASTCTATPSPRVTSSPPNGVSAASSERTTRCASGTSGGVGVPTASSVMSP